MSEICRDLQGQTSALRQPDPYGREDYVAYAARLAGFFRRAEARWMAAEPPESLRPWFAEYVPERVASRRYERELRRVTSALVAERDVTDAQRLVVRAQTLVDGLLGTVERREALLLELGASDCVRRR